LYGKIDEDEDEDGEGESDGGTDTDTGENEEEDDEESYIDFDTEVVFEEIGKGKSYVTFEGTPGFLPALFSLFLVISLPNDAQGREHRRGRRLIG
jgi:hypothetical protein